jgi:molybdopterin molybdotransferase
MALMSVQAAKQALLSGVSAPKRIETVGLNEALGRTLAQDIVSQHAVPPADNSAMDGFAVRAMEIVPGKPLPISQVVAAGGVASPLAEQTVARIFTGGQLPEGADAVLIQEDATWEDDQVWPKVRVQANDNVRPKGQDIAFGSRVACRGQRLRPADLSLLASVGLAELPVFKPLRVAILSTGDELVEPPNRLDVGQIYNSNRYALQGLLTQMGLQTMDLGIVRDDLEATIQLLREAASQADVIISSGGVSVGDRDFIKTAIEQLGELSVWKLAIKPGKPMAFGHVLGVPFFGLPGNPVSTFVTFLVLAKPYLEQLQGRINSEVITWPGVSTFSFQAGNRQEYLRVRAQRQGGDVLLTRFEQQGSGVMSSLSWANALAVVEPQQQIQSGDLLPYLFLDSV